MLLNFEKLNYMTKNFGRKLERIKKKKTEPLTEEYNNQNVVVTG